MVHYHNDDADAGNGSPVCDVSRPSPSCHDGNGQFQHHHHHHKHHIITCGDILKAHPYRLALAPPTLLGAIQTIVRPALVALPPFQVHPGALVSPQDPPPNKHLR